MLEDGSLETVLEERYADWKSGLGPDILDVTHNLESLATHVENTGLGP